MVGQLVPLRDSPREKERFLQQFLQMQFLCSTTDINATTLTKKLFTILKLITLEACTRVEHCSAERRFHLWGRAKRTFDTNLFFSGPERIVHFTVPER